MRPNDCSTRLFRSALVLCGFLLTSCSSTLTNEGFLNDASVEKMMEGVTQKKPTNVAARIPKDKINSIPRKFAAQGIKALDNHEYKKASTLFNSALKLDIRNSYLHFLNALTYHHRALQGENQLFALSEQG